MGLPTTTETEPRVSATSFAHRVKPRVSVSVQLVLAGGSWAIAAAILGYRGIGWALDASSTWVLIGIALGLAALKYRYVLTPTVLRTTDRIHVRGADACAGGFFSWKAWLMVLGMVAGGHALRLSAIPRPVLGVVYLAIAFALAAGATRFWRAAARARC